MGGSKTRTCKQYKETILSTDSENITILTETITYIDVRRKILYKYKNLLDGLVIDFDSFGETRHIVPPCNKAGIWHFCLEIQEFQEFQISNDTGNLPLKTSYLGEWLV